MIAKQVAKSPFVYQNVKVVRAVDGDTLELAIDAGFRFTFTDHFRLARINAPEKHKPGGAEAIAHIEMLLAKGIVSVETTKRDKYGRLLIEVSIPAIGGVLNLSDKMRIDGHAVAFME